MILGALSSPIWMASSSVNSRPTTCGGVGKMRTPGGAWSGWGGGITGGASKGGV